MSVDFLCIVKKKNEVVVCILDYGVGLVVWMNYLGYWIKLNR